jgi:hypothetical protein
MNKQMLESTTELRNIPSFETLMDKLQKTINNAWNIGNRIHQPSIDKWLENFTGEALCYCSEYKNDRHRASEREKQLALFLLCNFVYYNENEIKHLVRIMLDKYAHSVFSAGFKDTITDEDFSELISGTQFTFLGNISESSSYLLYHFRQENDLSRQCFIEQPSTKNIVFIDDFSITGSQAVSYIQEKVNAPTWDKSKRIYILLMIATVEAVEELKKIKGVTTLPCIVLDDNSKAFSDKSIVFAEYSKKCKDEARIMCEYYGKKIVDQNKNNGDMPPLGFGGSGYLFGAYYNVPDNTLPIFWSSLNNWNYLFKRYDKKYGISGGVIGGRYV